MTASTPTDAGSGFPINLALRDGTPVLIRPVRSDDKPLLEIGMERLSKESRYFRFFRPISTLTPKMLSQYTDIDHVHHEAICALDIGESPANPVGLARYIRMPEDGSRAEVAVTVVDSHQGRGLGTLLLAFLAHRASENGVVEFLAVVLGNNRRMLEVLKGLGSKTEFATAGELNVRMPLFCNPDDYPSTPAGDVFRQASETLRAHHS